MRTFQRYAAVTATTVVTFATVMIAGSSSTQARLCEDWPCFSDSKDGQAKKALRRSRIDAVRKQVRKKNYRGSGYMIAPHARTSCFPKRLKKLMKKVASHYGRPLIVTSGHRSHGHNRRIGGARESYHVKCMAVDFKIRGVNKYALARYLKKLPGRGGVGTYCGNSIVHLDVGPKRSWHHGCRKKHRRYASKKRRR